MPAWARGSDAWFDFVANRGAGMPALVDTHAATIYEPNAAGIYMPFAANEVVRTDLGLQTVPTRTNSLKNNSMIGAIAGSPGTLPTNWGRQAAAGISYDVAAVGTENGLPYIDIRIYGSNVSGGTIFPALFMDTQSVSGTVAAPSSVWDISALLKIVSGSLAGFSAFSLAINQFTAAGGYLSTGVAVSLMGLTGANARMDGAIALGATTEKICPILTGNIPNGASVDVVIRIAVPQIELGAFASAPILTTGAAVTVNGNQQVASGMGQLANGFAGIFQFDALSVELVAGRIALSLNDGSSSNQFSVQYSSSGNMRIGANSANAGTIVSSAMAPTPSAPYGKQTVAVAASPGFMVARVVGAPQGQVAIASAYPLNLDRIAFGGTGISTSTNSYQQAKKLALKYGPQDQASFDAMYAKALAA